MHSSSFDIETGNGRDGGDVLVAIAALVTEGRIPGRSDVKNRGFYEGPHCNIVSDQQGHNCNPSEDVCQRYNRVRHQILNLWRNGIPICVEVLLTTVCPCKEEPLDISQDDLLLEQWYFSITHNRLLDTSIPFNINQLISAVRSQLYFSQISAWLSSQDQMAPKITNDNLKYRLSITGETFEQTKFTKSANRHDFPNCVLGNGLNLKVSLLSLPRMAELPDLSCKKCNKEDMKDKEMKDMIEDSWLVDDRMHITCTLKGKHRCEDLDELDIKECKHGKNKRVCCSRARKCNIVNLEASTSNLQLESNKSSLLLKNCRNELEFKDDLSKQPNILINNILRSCRLQPNENVYNGSSTKCVDNLVKCDVKCVQKLGEIGSSILNGCAKALQSVSDTNSDKNVKSDIFNNKHKVNIYVDSNCDKQSSKKNNQQLMRDISNKVSVRQRIQFDDENNIECVKNVENSSNNIEIPTSFEQAKFRKSLDNAASMVFHTKTGLPLTSSPAPVRRGKNCFDFDSSINSVSSIKSAFFSTSFTVDDDSESDGSIVSPSSPETCILSKKQPSPVKHYRKGRSANLLGNFVESVLNGRLEPVSTVHGFKAELGASGSFVPRHLVVPVTVFFYTLGDNDKVSSPYLGHINLGKKGYNVPVSGKVQVTLFNPLGTVVKMFVILYDFSDMPPNSQTFIRHRTLCIPAGCNDSNIEWEQKWLRYLIHLRFMSTKSGRIYLHSDIRMIIFRKSDMDTATAHGMDVCHELRSYTHMPINPKYSPRNK